MQVLLSQMALRIFFTNTECPKVVRLSFALVGLCCIRRAASHGPVGQLSVCTDRGYGNMHCICQVIHMD